MGMVTGPIHRLDLVKWGKTPQGAIAQHPVTIVVTAKLYGAPPVLWDVCVSPIFSAPLKRKGQGHRGVLSTHKGLRTRG